MTSKFKNRIKEYKSIKFQGIPVKNGHKISMIEDSNLSELLGNEKSSVSAWCSSKLSYGNWLAEAGCSIKLTCNQDEDTIKKGYGLASDLAIKGMEHLKTALKEEMEALINETSGDK